jgi:hypothetical protein
MATLHHIKQKLATLPFDSAQGARIVCLILAYSACRFLSKILEGHLARCFATMGIPREGGEVCLF